MGSSVANAGDVNGDGLSDFIVGAYGDSPESRSVAGSVTLVFGRNNRTGLIVDTAAVPDASTAIRIYGPAAQSRYGIWTSTAGDLNKDGVDDFLVGASLYDCPGKNNCGAVSVIYGKTTGWATLDSATLTANNWGFWIWGANADDNAGISVGTVDFNNDGNPDIIVGAPTAIVSGVLGVGIVYILLGKGASTTSTDIDLSAFTSSSTNGLRVFGDTSAPAYLFGGRVSGAGDINDDGIEDVIAGAVGASYSGRTGCGAVWIIFGRTGALTDIFLGSIISAQGVAIYGASAGAKLGSGVSMAGDVNGDGVADIVIGANETTTFIGKTGAAYVILGRASGGTEFSGIDLASFTSGSDGFRIIGGAVSDSLGTSVAGGGDVNNDGYDDVVIGAKDADPSVGKSGAGITYVIYGKDEGSFADINLANFASTLGYRVDGEASSDQSGWSVALLPDYDGDGLSDVGIGAYVADPPDRPNGGKAYMLFSVSTGSSEPTSQPSSSPTSSPSTVPTSAPSTQPSGEPTGRPSTVPSAAPSGAPTSTPSSTPTSRPSVDETGAPSSMPSARPSAVPSAGPSSSPSSVPSSVPTMMPSAACLPGYYLVPSNATALVCTPCPVGTHSEVTNAFQCDDCPYPFTTVDPGAEHCAAVHLDTPAVGTASVFGLLGVAVVCAVAVNAGSLTLVFLAAALLFTLDTLTDLAYILVAKFVSRTVFGCCIAFFLLTNIALVGSIFAAGLVMSYELMYQALVLRAVLGAVPQIVLQLYNQTEGEFSAIGIISVIASGLAIICGVVAIAYLQASPTSAPIKYAAPAKAEGDAVVDGNATPVSTYDALVGEGDVEMQEQGQEEPQRV